MHSVFIGFDPRDTDAFVVTRRSVTRSTSSLFHLSGLHLASLRERGLYWRKTSQKPNQVGRALRLWDDISDAPMSTEFAISRFLTPLLSRTKWALFMDGDMLVRANLREFFELADDRYAVMCVKHQHRGGSAVKMDGQYQTDYPRKNWSSVMLFNCHHPSNAALDLDMVNSKPGRDLHRFCWLKDEEIGELPARWNYIPGVSLNEDDPAIVHFSLGVPSTPRYENVPYADEWRRELAAWAQGDSFADIAGIQGAEPSAA